MDQQTRVKLSVTAMGILAFVLAYFGYVELLFLLIAYAVFLDKSENLTKMSFQALYLQLSYRVVLLVFGWIFGFFRWFFNLFDAYKAYSAVSTFEGYFRTILSLLVFVAYLLAVISIISKKNCNLPLLGSLADKTMGIFRPKAAPAPQAYQQPVYQQPPQAPQPAPQAPVHQAPVHQAPPPQTPQQSAPPAPAPAASATWKCSCGHENSGNFCMKCGNPRP